ncbi:MAG TPA: cupredoxin family copper-binding protein [Dehalococcoidia bacterium]|nr:cupredoxin family copper-binding protein [Dehalococcoidia bacterium]
MAALAGAVFLGGMAAMAVFMAGQMNGGMMGMMNRAGNSPQTPVVADQRQVAVEIRNFEYFPRDLTVAAGTEVTWTNRDTAPHSATDKGKGWDTGLLNKDASKTLTFNTPGSYSYFCAVHPSMKATLTVR